MLYEVITDRKPRCHQPCPKRRREFAQCCRWGAAAGPDDAVVRPVAEPVQAQRERGKAQPFSGGSEFGQAGCIDIADESQRQVHSVSTCRLV